jgi:hypothetical protein
LHDSADIILNGRYIEIEDEMAFKELHEHARQLAQ